MAQCGVPFGEIALVRDWVGVCEPVAKPANEHPKRPVDADCAKSEVEVGGVCGLVQGAFRHGGCVLSFRFVANYCPLAVFMEAGGKNRTLRISCGRGGCAVCGLRCTHLQALVQVLDRMGDRRGAFAESATGAWLVLEVQVGRVLHPGRVRPPTADGPSESATGRARAFGLGSAREKGGQDGALPRTGLEVGLMPYGRSFSLTSPARRKHRHV